MLVIPYNDLDELERLVTPVVDRVAGIIAEPVQRIIRPSPDSSKACGASVTGTASC